MPLFATLTYEELTGVVGDATRASAALGAQLWERTVDRVTAMIEALTHASARGDVYEAAHRRPADSATWCDA